LIESPVSEGLVDPERGESTYRAGSFGGGHHLRQIAMLEGSP